MKGKKLIATLALSTMLFTGCGIKSTQTIIKVNDTKITQAQFDDIFDKEAESGKNSPLHLDIKDPKNVFMYNLVKNRVVNELIVKALLDEEANKRNIKVTNEDLEQAIKEIIDKVGSKEQLDAILKQSGVSVSEFKKDLKDQVRIKKLADSLGSNEVSDSEVKDYYNKNIEKFKHPEQVRASHILIAVNPQEMIDVVKSDSANEKITNDELNKKVEAQIKEKEAKANEIFKKAKQDPSSFAKLAKENSDDPGSAQQGGELGFFAHKEMVPEFSNAAFKAKPNTVIGPVKSPYGYHIIMVTDRKTAGVDSFDTVKNNLKQYLANQKRLEQVDSLIESLKKQAKIEFVNKDYDPEEIQKTVQKSLQENADAANKAAQEASKK